MIRLAQPLWLLVLLVPLILFLLDLLLQNSVMRRRYRHISQKLWPSVAQGESTAMRRTRRALFLLALLLISIGLANPQIGTEWEEVTREGIDIFLLVDVSRSMDTQDIRPSRIEKTKFELREFLEGLEGDRIGVIPFAGTAYPLCPQTMDYAAARMFLNLLQTDLIPTPGTAIGDAIETALESFPEEEEGERGRAIILVSDGEDHEGGAVDAARRAGSEGVPVYTIGMALSKEDPIPTFDEEGRSTGWMTDDEGRPVTSRLNEDLLRDIARESGGSYYRATQSGDEFRAVYRQLFGLDREEMTSRRISNYEDRFYYFLGAALLLLILETMLPSGGWKVWKRSRFELDA